MYILRAILSRFGIKPVEINPEPVNNNQSMPDEPSAPPVVIPPVEPSPVKPLSIPHPEELPDWDLTLHDVDAFMVVNEWLRDWEVPTEYWSYWQTIIDIQVYLVYPDYMVRWGVQQGWPSFAWFAEGKRHMAIKPAYLNPGVICHEQCHNSYSLLTEEQKDAFELTYNDVQNDQYIKLLHSINNYMNTLDSNGRHVEGHAEIGRYIGQFMPEELKKFYPRLMI